MATRNKRAELTSEIGVVDSITAAEVENIVAKAVKAAVTVVRQEFDKRFNECKTTWDANGLSLIEAVARPSAPDSAELNELNDEIDAVTHDGWRFGLVVTRWPRST